MIKKVLRGLSAAFISIATLTLGMTSVLNYYSYYINDYLGTVDTYIVNENASHENAYYKSDYFDNTTYNPKEIEYTPEQALRYTEDKLQFIQDTVGEGIVLVKNNGVLPLKSLKKVSGLGRVSAALHYCGTSGSSIIPTSNCVTLMQAFEKAGIELNPVAYNFYKGRSEAQKTAESATQASIGETPVSAYTSDVNSSWANYNDAAFVIFSRPGGEGNDLTKSGGNDFTGSQLELSNDEKDVLNIAKSNFDKVVVILNSDHPIAIGSLKDDPQIDAIIVAGGLGVNGAYSLVNVITGAINPSGRLNDTWAINSLSAAATQNSGRTQFANASEIDSYIKNANGKNYVAEIEGIYIGYKYYETRYEDTVIGGRNADSAKGVFASAGGHWDYNQEMGYTFGYGLSYTQFNQTIESVTFNENKSIANVKVKVNNVGDVAGKDVAQIWFQSPYTDYDIAHGIEKAAIQIADYAKTGLIEPGQSEVVDIEVQLANVASYDAKEAKTFIMDAGDYYFALGNGAHHALNNILAAKGYSETDGMDEAGDASKTYHWTLDSLDQETYSKSRYTGYDITNLFDEADINYWLDDAVTYLTRNDWNTFPEEVTGLTATKEMMDRLACNQNITGWDYSRGEYDAKEDPTYKSHKTELGLYQLVGKDFDDPMWEDLLDQLSMLDTALIVGVGNCQTEAIQSIFKQKTMGGDGPTGFAGLIQGSKFNGGKLTFRAYFSENLCTATWSKECANRFGYFIGEDGLFGSKTDLWGPGANLHRTPFSGRNAEYPSEDGVLGYEQLAAQCKGMADKGLIAAPKHFAFNDQETNRSGLCNFVTEQAAREIILKIYEGCFTEGHAMGTMSSYPRIGLDYMGTSHALLTTWLRKECGFKGYITTDMAGSGGYMRPVESVKAGVTLFDNNGYSQRDVLYDAMEDDVVLRKAMRQGAHYTLYAFANSNAMNGFDENSHLVRTTPWWMKACIGVDIGVAVLAIASITGYALLLFKSRNKKEKEG